MKKSATDVMEEVVFAAVVDGIVALKAASKGLPNTLLRDLNAIHANATLADMPKELQAAITTSVRAAFTRLMKDGYTVTSNDAPSPRPAPMQTRPQGTGRPQRPGGPGRPNPNGPSRPPRGGAPGPRDRKPRPPR